MRLKYLFLNLLLLGFSTFAGLASVEAMLRLTDSVWERERRQVAGKPNQVVYIRQNSGLHALAPSQLVSHRGACFDVSPVSVNNLGFRGEPLLPAEPSIALLGDSFAEALQIPDGLTFADHLSRSANMQVINAGVSGYATTHEVFAWKQRLASLHPRLVVVLMYLGNDISGNSCALSRTVLPCGKFENGQIRIIEEGPAAVAITSQPGAKAAPGQASFQFRQWLRHRLALYSLAHDAKMIARGLLAEMRGQVDARWGLYQTTPDPLWDDAWRVTADMLSTLKADIDASGAEIVLVAIPEPVAFMPNPRQAIHFGAGSAVPDDLDLTLPSRRLAALAQEIGIRYLDLFPILSAYRDRHHLPAPYFSFACDGHWNPLGHRIAAAALSNFLARRGQTIASGPSLESLMSVSPLDLLGEDAYRQIFQGGVYRPKAATE